MGIDVVGNRAFLADTKNGLEVYDVSDPELPVLVGSAAGFERPFDVSVLGSTAYVADSTGGIKVLDVGVRCPYCGRRP